MNRLITCPIHGDQIIGINAVTASDVLGGGQILETVPTMNISVMDPLIMRVDPPHDGQCRQSGTYSRNSQILRVHACPPRVKTTVRMQPSATATPKGR